MAVTRQVTVVLLLVIAVTHCIIVPKKNFSPNPLEPHPQRHIPAKGTPTMGVKALESVSMMATDHSNFQGI